MLEPLIVRSSSAGKYEIVSGHRRAAACKELGMRTVPVIIKELSKDEAIIAMVDANLQRENLLPSEKAFAYKMKLEAQKSIVKQGAQLGHLKSRDIVAQDSDDSREQIRRYIRLTYLIPELLKLVDEGKIAFTPAVELSYLPEREQQILFEEIEYADATPSLSQAQRLRRFSNDNRFSVDTVFAVLSEEKPNQKEQVRFKKEDIQKYFPQNYNSKDMSEVIVTLLEKWQRQRQRNAREER